MLRLIPGEDVRIALRDLASAHRMEAAAITSAVGSLTQAHLRYANRADGMLTSGDLEVLSLSGTLSMHGLHLHLSIGDRNGQMLGGHMLEGCLVRTTLEVIVQEITGVRMLRTKDEMTTYDELDPTPLPSGHDLHQGTP